MALIAEDAKHRVEQLLAVTERLGALIADETRRIQAREPLLSGADAEEKNRLANAYRLELARIKQDTSLVDTAPAELLLRLRAGTERLHETLGAHEISLAAVKVVTEGLVQAMAEEVVRQRGATGYGARGKIEAVSGPRPAIVDHSA